MNGNSGLHINVRGIVQGVGFRPFVYKLAQGLDLKGWVRNTSAGVDIELDGSQEALTRFMQSLRGEAPPLAKITEIKTTKRSPNGYGNFEIKQSLAVADAFQPVSADVAICPDCLRELFDPADRHYRYPFVNCTNCGPRFTIIKDLPYDRPLTTMAEFAMCTACAHEYQDPTDRRYHAQPVSCPECGPQIWLEIGGETIRDQEEALKRVRAWIAAGEIAAVKGLGGFHLACDATNADAVRRLRERKARPDKPLAVMLADTAAVRRHCLANEFELATLHDTRRPILIVQRNPESNIATEVGPGQQTLGVMLPYTPLHTMLMERAEGISDAWVMTSGNRSDEPILIDNEEARQQLAGIATAFLMHDRPIQARCDDSVMRVKPKTQALIPIRRGRGFAPAPIDLSWDSHPMLAAGAELKNTFCLAKGKFAFPSQHIGDLGNYETLQAYEAAIAHFERLLRIKPRALAYDLHPDYLSSRYALKRAQQDVIPAIGVQHHHAHIAACMAEHGLPSNSSVIGLAFDGTGFGTDGTIWGGEVLVASYVGFERAFHLTTIALPGGDLAVRQPWRQALAWLGKLGMEEERDLPALKGISETEIAAVKRQLQSGVNTPLTSSMGRLFDAVAALIGLRREVNYEGQAAIELENLVDLYESNAYHFEITESEFNARSVIAAVVADLRAGTPAGKIAARFHNGLTALVLELCTTLRKRTGLKEVTLSGGVWQNMTLLSSVMVGLQAAGFQVLTHHQVPANDGGISLGQAAVAQHTLIK